MRTHQLHPRRQWTLNLLVALVVMLSVVYTPVAVHELTGATLATTAYACDPHSSGGGGC